jgi:hypothetical protein
MFRPLDGVAPIADCMALLDKFANFPAAGRDRCLVACDMIEARAKTPDARTILATTADRAAGTAAFG